jgi:hypothetical protein
MDLQTLWIAPQDGSIKLVAELPDLIVPRTDGFWRVGVRNYCEPPDYWSVESQDVFFAVPVSQHPTIKEGLIPCVQAKKMAEEKYKELLSKPNKTKHDDDILAGSEQNGPAYECSSFSITVEFVNPLFISTSGSYEVECGVHPDGTLSYGVSRFGPLSQPPVSLSSLFGKKATDTYMDLAKQALVENADDQSHPGSGQPQEPGGYGTDLSLEELSKKDSARFPDNVNDQEWYITRHEGRWLELGGINTHRLCGGAVQFPLPTDKFTWSLIDKSVPLDMKWLRSLLPNAKDAFWSPRKDLLVVLTNNDSLAVFKPHGERIGTPLLTLELTRGRYRSWPSGLWEPASSVGRAN